ncbi:MAG TPA: Gfo/Idh/MocA family oxidoreductase [Chloroflexota bacterium]|nr:Gfo/Idh/MocA family oxidoreductase [Chloroflexota bacterium]
MTSLKFGIVDCDTSHVVAFTQRLNHLEIAADHWVHGAEVVAAVPMPSLVSPERVPRFVEQLRRYGVQILERPEDLLGKVDAVLVEANDGMVHRERALPFIEAGLPVFVDKPFACSVADARAIVAAARRRQVPLLSSSSLRWDLPVQDVLARREELGRVTGADAFAPGAQHPRNPGFFHYGVHAVELVYTLMGTGCRRVRCVRTDGADVALGEWADGRLATVRAVRDGAHRIGFTAITEQQVVQGTSSGYGYREQLQRIVRMCQTGEWPLPEAALVEPVAFQEAALLSMDRDGAPVELAEVDAQA